MALTTGTHRLGPETGRLIVRTSRTGLGRKAGHDLTIEVTRWSAKAVVDVAEPATSSVIAEIEAASFEVREGRGGVKPLTDSDRAEIETTLREKILRTADHPLITFRSTTVTGSPEAFMIEGDLTIMDRTHPVTVRARMEEGRLTGGATVVQSEWGIKPYSAFFGALRLADPVEIAFDLSV